MIPRSSQGQALREAQDDVVSFVCVSRSAADHLRAQCSSLGLVRRDSALMWLLSSFKAGLPFGSWSGPERFDDDVVAVADQGGLGVLNVVPFAAISLSRESSLSSGNTGPRQVGAEHSTQRHRELVEGSRRRSLDALAGSSGSGTESSWDDDSANGLNRRQRRRGDVPIPSLRSPRPLRSARPRNLGTRPPRLPHRGSSSASTL